MKKYFTVVFLILILLVRVFTSDKAIGVMRNVFGSGGEVEDRVVVVIDPGHGGRDPGKVAVNNALEKDINLEIAMRLKTLLEQNDIKVVMTREEDIGLYEETDSNKKGADLRKRVEIIHSSQADFSISIHQNSFAQEAVKGAQVFYHSRSTEGKRLAEILQKQLKDSIKDDNHRKAKSNTNYYMLKHTECPLVIVECGYLSNYQEADLLIEEEYQNEMAWAIHLGIMQYINEEGL